MPATRPATRFARAIPLALGIEIEADLAAPLTGDERVELRRLFHEHGFLLFRGQSFPLETQAEILSAIGPVLDAVDGKGYISTDETRGSLGDSELIFHSDLDFSPWPLRALSLLAIDLVDGASSTRFVHSGRALDRLPASMREQLRRLRLLTVLPTRYDQLNLDREIDENELQVWRAPIVAHPETGREYLSVSQQAARFEGMSAAASRELLERLFAGLYAPENVHEHVWHQGDFIIWDNVLLQHARSSLAGCGRRTLQRVALGDHSFFDLEPGAYDVPALAA